MDIPFLSPSCLLANQGRMLGQAASHGILVMPVLWSFVMAKNNRANLESSFEESLSTFALH